MKHLLLVSALLFTMLGISQIRFPNYNKDIQQEKLDRGLVAIRYDNNSVCVSWRYLPSDALDAQFDVYRAKGNSKPKKINVAPLANATFYVDSLKDDKSEYTYSIRLTGSNTTLASYTLTKAKAATPYLTIDMVQVEGDKDWKYSPNDASVADLDGDGEYEIIVKREGRSHDNSHTGLTDPLIIDAYKLNGKLMWRINMGPNIRAGAHYTQFIVYDFDGDGKAEMALRTSELTTFGDGTQIGDTDGDGRTNYLITDPNSSRCGFIMEGPEFLSIVDGTTGKELARTNYIPREMATYGDNYANRCDRFLAGLGYIDGHRPSIIMCRGYYERTTIEAYNYRDGQLTKVWRFDTMDNNGQYEDYKGQGNHNLSIGDVDGDGCDEITYGAMLIDHDGKPGYNTHLGHGDAMHLTDIDIDREGLEVWDCHESAPSKAGGELRDARTGELLFGLPAIEDVGRALAADIDPRFRGCELWDISSEGVYTANGKFITENRPSINFSIFWDGDLNRELFDGSERQSSRRIGITKWNGDGTNVIKVQGLNTNEVATNNYTKGNPCIQADILGDWREELVVRTTDNKQLRIFTTSHPTDYRFYCLMLDPIYRNAVAAQNVAYNQPPHTGFYLGSDLGKFAPIRHIEKEGYRNNHKSGRSWNNRPNGLNERLKATQEVIVDTYYCNKDSIILDALCDYQSTTWNVNGKEIGTGRKVVIKRQENQEQKIQVDIEAIQHGCVFRGTVYVEFKDNN